MQEGKKREETIEGEREEKRKGGIKSTGGKEKSNISKDGT